MEVFSEVLKRWKDDPKDIEANGALLFELDNFTDKPIFSTTAIHTDSVKAARAKSASAHMQVYFRVPRVTGTGPNLLSMGRHKEQSIILPDASVSNEHGYLVLHADGRVALIDQGSKNGCQVNGQKLFVGEPKVLATGDALRIGSVRGVFVARADMAKYMKKRASEKGSAE